MRSSPSAPSPAAASSSGASRYVRADLVDDLPRKVDHVLADVAVLRHLGLPAVLLQVSGEQAQVEALHLAAGVVEVILPLHVVPGGRHHLREGAAEDGAAGVADVDRSGGIDADELELHALAGPCVDVAVAGPGPDDGVDLPDQPVRAQRDVDEARRRYGHGAYRLVLGHRGDELLRDNHWAHAHGARQPHRGAGREVAVPGPLRALHERPFDASLGQVSLGLGLRERGADQSLYVVSYRDQLLLAAA